MRLADDNVCYVVINDLSRARPRTGQITGARQLLHHIRRRVQFVEPAEDKSLDTGGDANKSPRMAFLSSQKTSSRKKSDLRIKLMSMSHQTTRTARAKNKSRNRRISGDGEADDERRKSGEWREGNLR